MSITSKSIQEIHEMIKNKEASFAQVTEAAYDRIKATDDKIKAYLALNEDAAKAQAAELDKSVTDFEEMPILAGIPFAVKDNIVTKGLATTAASKMLEGHVPVYESTVMMRLYAAGAVPVGKTNMDEFAMGSSTEKSAYQVTHNPWDLDRTPGGSSGGSAASVAAGQVVFALGTDTGGSVRQPAALNNLVGIKPTYGLVSRNGVISSGPSMDQVGPMARRVADVAEVLQAIAGFDGGDAVSVDMDIPDYREALTGDINGMKIGLIKEHMDQIENPEAKKVMEEAVAKFRELGATVEEISIPNLKYSLAVYHTIASTEVFSDLGRYDGIRYGHRPEGVKDLVDLYYQSRTQGFGPEVKRRIMLGAHVLSSENYETYFVQAQKVRTLIIQDMASVLAKYDLLLGPTATDVAAKLGADSDKTVEAIAKDNCTVAANLAGLPAMSVPAGFVQGLPFGLQLMGAAFDEETVLRAGHAFEAATKFYEKSPAL